MFRKISAILMGIWWLGSSLAAAAGSPDQIELGNAIGKRPLEAVIVAPTSAEAGRLMVFDGTQSYNPPGSSGSLRYFWEFGDGETSIAAEVGHRYQKPGHYQVRLTIANDNQKIATEQVVVIYKNRALLIADGTTNPEVIETFQTEARTNNMLLDEIRTASTGTDFEAEHTLHELLQKRVSAVEESPLLILWTDGERGLSALTSFQQKNPQIDFRGKTILIIANKSVRSLLPFGKIAFRVLQPREIIIATPDAVYTSLLVRREALTAALKNAEKDFVKIDQQDLAFRGYNLMSQGVVFLLAHGVPQRSLALLLMLPLIATIVVVSKQIIGLNMMGIYIPSIVAIALIAIGFWQGIAILLVIILTTIFYRKFSKKWRMMYYPKMAIASIVMTLAIFALLGASALISDISITTASVFPLLVMILITEKFTSIQTGKGLLGAVRAFGGTFMVAILTYALVEKVSFFKTLFLVHPEIILALLLLNYLIGQYRGLRLTEQWRFGELQEYSEDEE